MFKWFKKYFIPHKVNDYKPHVFREVSALAIFVIVVCLFLFAVSGPILIGKDFTALVLPKVLVDYANQDRDTKSYGHLAISPVLEKAAQLKANDMAENGYFAHKSPDGKTPWYWFKQVGYDFAYAGENLAVNFNDSIDVNTAWMNSPGHRANIMNDNFTEIGIATADGMYQGRKTTFVVQLFGRPAESEKSIVVTNKQTVTKTAKTVPVVGSSSAKVLSESVTKEVLNEETSNDLFVAVAKNSAVATASPNIKYSSFLQKVLLSPKAALSFFYMIIALILVLGLIFTIFVEFRVHNLRMVMLAVGLLIVIFGLLYIYKSIIISPLYIA